MMTVRCIVHRNSVNGLVCIVVITAYMHSFKKKDP